MMTDKIPTIEIDMDKKCSDCGKGGACQNGLCLSCVSKRITAKYAMKKVETFVDEDQGNLFEDK